jgi:membrane-associated PAP2 superfamily phosphatase
MKLHQLWWHHIRLPLVCFAVLAGIFATTFSDIAIARTMFFDPAHMRWIGDGSWWVNDFLHSGGRWLIRGLAAAAAALWIASWMQGNLGALRRPAAYFVVAAALSIGTVGLLKLITNVDCPWDLSQFGGRFPFVELFADRPDTLRQGHCFPAAHASSGYALFALYFAFRERSWVMAKLGLALGGTVGLIFGLAQQSRGAHFASHDVWSAFLVWVICSSIYVFMFKARLWDGRQGLHAGYALNETSVAAGGLVIGGHIDVHGRTGGLARATRR